MFYLTGMAEKLKYHAFKRNTLLEELQTILHEYPDNEQIIKVSLRGPLFVLSYGQITVTINCILIPEVIV